MSGKNFRNPERGINRYQMMEILARIAEEKYINKYQKAKNMFEAIEMFWNGKLYTNIFRAFKIRNDEFKI